MNIIDLLNDAYAFNGDLLHRKAVDEIERLRGQSKMNWDAFQKAATEIERLREALQHILTHYKSDTPPNAQALILFVNRALEDKE